MKRILQSVCRPVRTTRWNNGTDRSFANRITFNNENGVHVHKISENHQSLNRVLDRAGEILCMPKKAKIALYVSVCSRSLSDSLLATDGRTASRQRNTRQSSLWRLKSKLGRMVLLAESLPCIAQNSSNVFTTLARL